MCGSSVLEVVTTVLAGIEITSADFGPFPVPNGIKEAFTAMVEEAYTGSLGPVATGLRIESIVIADGVMTIAGRIR